jgi:YD repeat-containing protein
VVNDGKATQTFEYGGGTERRGLPTKLIDSQAGTFTAEYDADGELIRETWPNGIVAETAGDEAGSTVEVSYRRPGCGQTDRTVYRETAAFSAHNQQRTSTSTFSQQRFDYDQASRLTDVKDTVANACSTRVYKFDNASNRTQQDSYPADASGGCQDTTGVSTRTREYDEADRLISPGTVYDPLGRTTTVPGHGHPSPVRRRRSATTSTTWRVGSTTEQRRPTTRSTSC